MDAIDFLIAQHRTLEAHMQETLAQTDCDARAAAFARVADDLTVHIASEEQVFYPAVHAKRTEDILLESLEEHLSLKRLLADLIELPPDAQTFEPKFKVLREQSEHHHGEEEEHLFPKVRTLLGPDTLSTLGEQMAQLQQRLQREGEPREAVADETDQAAPLR